MTRGPNDFTEDEYKRDRKRIIKHLMATGRANVVRADGTIRVAISIPGPEPHNDEAP